VLAAHLLQSFDQRVIGHTAQTRVSHLLALLVGRVRLRVVTWLVCGEEEEVVEHGAAGEGQLFLVAEAAGRG